MMGRGGSNAQSGVWWGAGVTGDPTWASSSCRGFAMPPGSWSTVPFRPVHAGTWDGSRGQSVQGAQPALTCWELWALPGCQPPARLSPAPITEHTASVRVPISSNKPQWAPHNRCLIKRLSPLPGAPTDRHRTPIQSPLHHSQTPLTSPTNYQLLTASPVRGAKRRILLRWKLACDPSERPLIRSFKHGGPGREAGEKLIDPGPGGCCQRTQPSCVGFNFVAPKGPISLLQMLPLVPSSYPVLPFLALFFFSFWEG